MLFRLPLIEGQDNICTSDDRGHQYDDVCWEVLLIFLVYLKAKVMFAVAGWITYARVDRQTQFRNFQYEMSSWLTHIFFTGVLTITLFEFRTLKCLLKMHFVNAFFYFILNRQCFNFRKRILFSYSTFILRKNHCKRKQDWFHWLLDFLLKLRSAIPHCL